ncbi:hypothetical protein [Actinoplanes sp. NPDC048796]|uniref:hypothetical protein n=1 Tax=unclassified Actinoplanes TaxID=2626549 RepID=UPI0033C128A8
MFATIKSLIPEPRQADQPRHYVGRHRKPEPVPVPISPAPAPPTGESVPEGDASALEGKTQEIAAA